MRSSSGITEDVEMKKAVYLALTVFTLFSMLLSGCASPAAPAEAPTTAAAAPTSAPEAQPTQPPAAVQPTQPPAATQVTHEPVTLKYLDYSQERLEFYKQAAVEFNKEFPWITLVPETMTEDDYKQALPLAFQSDSAPDIFVYTWPAAGDYFELKDLLSLGWVAPFDESVLPADFRARFRGTQNMMEGLYSKDGKVYTIPRPPSNGAAGYAYMYYNKDVVKAAGLTDKIPATWQEFKDACAKIKAAGKYCFAAAMKEPRELDRLIGPFMGTGMKGYNDSLISTMTGEYTAMTDPDFVATIQFLRSLYEAGYAVPGQNDKVFSRQSVANGDAAFYFDGGWMSSVFPTTFQFTNFGVAIPLAPEGGYKGKIASGPPLGQTFISAQSKHVYEATLYLEWMTRPDGWYTQNFMKNGFDILPWGDPEKLLSYMPADNPTRDLIPLDPQVHVMAPQASLKCPDLAKSEARNKVDELQTDWGYVAMVDYLSNGGDWVSIATKIQDAQNKVFEETLKSEAASGLKVSTECFAEPKWDGLTDFDYSVYK
jgi:ABC-type glycerol-3-phosphate transport system substrate-binding protein